MSLKFTVLVTNDVGHSWTVKTKIKPTQVIAKTDTMETAMLIVDNFKFNDFQSSIQVWTKWGFQNRAKSVFCRATTIVHPPKGRWL